MNTTNLIQGDCLEVMKTIPDGSIDAIITDPPYGTTACKWDTVIDFDLMWNQLNRVIKKNGAIVLFGSEPFSSALRMSNIKNFKYDWIWNKLLPSGHLNVKVMPLKYHEIISVFSNSKHHYNRQFTTKPINHRRVNKYKTAKKRDTTISKDAFGEHKGGYASDNDDSLCSPKSIIEFQKDKKEQYHPTQKPVKLIEYLIRTYTNKNETVLDFTMGSGTTGIACHNLDRNFIGIELDKGYFKIASDRITEHKRQQKLF